MGAPPLALLGVTAALGGARRAHLIAGLVVAGTILHNAVRFDGAARIVSAAAAAAWLVAIIAGRMLFG